MKNYYDILEVSSKASKEVIEKAYKVLIKKNHPDIHNPDINKMYENYMKDLNEAYDVLSNDFLREQYDKELNSKREEQIEKKYTVSSDKTEKTSNASNQNNKNVDKQNKEIIEPGIIGLLKLLFRKRDFNFKIEPDKEERKKNLIALGLTALIIISLGLILYFLPFTHNWMDKNFIQNPLVQGIKKLFS